MVNKSYIKSAIYSSIMDDIVYCTINRSLIPWADYGKELRALRKAHDTICELDRIGNLN